MVSINPASQIYDMKHMYDFTDHRSIKKCSYPEDSLMGIINSTSDFSIFAGIVKKARYDIKLSATQADYTIFVPSNFYLKQKYTDEYLNNIDEGFAIKIVNFSMMDRKIEQNVLQSSPSSTFPTINRSRIVIKTKNCVTLLQNSFKVIHWNYLASNGLIHVIDGLLIPDNNV
jgi:uncharacterized surface protein with fasciclin (FAS1) repeats